MKEQMLKKNLIFYNPGKKGTAFTVAANNYVTPDLLQQTIDHLEYETESTIKYVEERRSKPRPLEH